MRKFLIGLFVFLFLLGFSSRLTLAASNYGDGTYGGGEYGVGETTTVSSGTSTSPPGPPGPPVCTDTVPTGPNPWIYSATASSSSSITFKFTNWQSPVDHFALEYGTSAGSYQFAVGNIGGQGLTGYTINELSPNTTYYFRVRAGNGCATGPWSNELSVNTQTRFGFITQQDQLDTEIVQADVTKKDEKEGGQNAYTVKAGDSLYSIALEIFGDSSYIQKIIDANKDKYPSLASNSGSLKVGWELLIPGKTEIVDGSDESNELVGVNVKIKVVDDKKLGVVGAKVTLFSTPREATTDKDGIAHFDKVEPGDHRVVIAYKNQNGEQSINIQDDPTAYEISFVVQLKPTSPFKDPYVITVIGGLALVAFVAIFVLLKKKR